MGLSTVPVNSEAYYDALSIMAFCKKPKNANYDKPDSGMFDAAIAIMVANHESGLNVMSNANTNKTHKYLYQQDKYWLEGREKKISNEISKVLGATTTSEEKKTARSEMVAVTTDLFLNGNKRSVKGGLRKFLREGYKYEGEDKKIITVQYNTPKEDLLSISKLNDITDPREFYGIMKANFVDKMATKVVRKITVKEKGTILEDAYESYKSVFVGVVGSAVAKTQGWENHLNNDGSVNRDSLVNFIGREIGQEVGWRKKLEVAIELIKEYWEIVVSQADKKSIDAIADSATKQVTVKVDDTDRKTSGIWKLFRLDYVNRNIGNGNSSARDGFGAIDKLRINDISYASSIGSFMNLFNKINQEPFVQNFGNSNGQRYDRTVRLSPFTKSLWEQLGYYTVDKTNVYSDNLFWETDMVFSWYRLIPSGNFWGDTSNVLEYLPAVFFPEYAEVFGSKPLDVTCNYVNYEAVGRNTIESSLKLLRFMIECHAYMPFTRKGEIKITYSPKIRIGQRLKYLPTGEMFYIDSVKHFVNYGNHPSAYSIVKVSRGMLEDVDDYFNIIVFKEEEEKRSFKTPPPADSKWSSINLIYKSFYFNDKITEFDTNIIIGGDNTKTNSRYNIDNHLNYISKSFLNCLKDCRAPKSLSASQIDRMIIEGGSDSYYKYKRYSGSEKKTGDGWERVQTIGKEKTMVIDKKYYVSSYFYKKLLNAYGDFKTKEVLIKNTLEINRTIGRKKGNQYGESISCPYFVFYNKASDELGDLSKKVLSIMENCATLYGSIYSFDEKLFKDLAKDYAGIDIENTIILNKAMSEFFLDKNNEQSGEVKVVGVVNYKTILSQPKIDQKKARDESIDTTKYPKSSTDYALNLEAIKEVGDFLIRLVDRCYGSEEESMLSKPIAIYASSSSEGIKTATNTIDTGANESLASRRRDFVVESIRSYCVYKIKDSEDERYRSFSDAEVFKSFFDFRDVVIGKYVSGETDKDTVFFEGVINPNYIPTTENLQSPNYSEQFIEPATKDWSSINKTIARFHHEFRGVRVHYNEYIPKISEAEVSSETKSVEEVEKKLKWYVDKKIFRKLLAKRQYGIKERYNYTDGRDRN